ncbi:hypothetical protein [Azoarcus sp. KH32C]|uniref:hypothetical protein n=1 Tax=Azoarcus sp. KH32C TaxID=748247 RepID=UPI0002386FC1|nr:hypothetical protein [Azoarcus sp. KH32C]BAL23430.1 hypothetical protein AZKH_1100 [Azoarcus sp. KH32C]
MNARQLVLGIALVATVAATWWASQDKGADNDVVRAPRSERSRSEGEASVAGGKTDASAPAQARADRYAALTSARSPWPDVAEMLARRVNFSPPVRSAPPAPPPAPMAPPLPYRFVGAIEDAQGKAVFLLDGSQVRLVREGEKLGSQYRVERITSNGIEITYLPLDVKQTLSRQSP